MFSDNDALLKMEAKHLLSWRTNPNFKPQFYAHELDWHDVFTVKLTTIKQVFTFDFLFKVLLELVLKRTYPIQ